MDSNITSIIVGGGIAIASGAIGHFVSYYFKSKSEKKKYVFERLEDVINCIGNIEQMMQQDIAGILKLTNPDEKKEISLSFQQNKLECLIKIYHPSLTSSINKLKDKIKIYHSTKVEILNLERQPNPNQELVKKAYDKLVNVFEEFVEETRLFIAHLTEYGKRKTK
ncbi:hypothetical protein EJ994_17265 [Maribacter sp. MJ134]|uniref:hypothetical protein n=1 Tax=Maribacter sp. MJ134 TaxID=2496865 RepID=UPI000F8309A6|nr:hypothetical protein [Maribacter sp. MJ134]AZQ60445.1 hypothetical protein EJ994_17190 [Maribacter sp. MJ134]AZQ60460.1 hypothetical protein EJ994_17265 [Maribacter sp. MJ134]